MTFKVSTGLRNKLLDTSPFKTAMAGCFLDIHAGTVPASADDAIVLGSSPLLCRISLASGVTGLTFEALAAAGVLLKNSGEVWSGVNAASGVATFYRLKTSTDTNTTNVTDARVQGSVGFVGEDLNLSNTSLTSGATQTIDYYAVTLPTL